MVITREQFNSYEAIRKSGVTNMWDIKRVRKLTLLENEAILYIMAHYGELREQFTANKKLKEIVCKE